MFRRKFATLGPKSTSDAVCVEMAQDQEVARSAIWSDACRPQNKYVSGDW